MVLRDHQSTRSTWKGVRRRSTCENVEGASTARVNTASLDDDGEKKSKRAYPTAGKKHVQKNVKSTANCLHELHMDDWLRREQTAEILVQEGSQPRFAAGRNEDQVQDKDQDQDRGYEHGRKLQQTLLFGSEVDRL